MEKKVRIVLETKYFRFGYEKVTIKPVKEVKQLPRETKGATINLYA
jgi:hypothetical protein